MSQDETEIGVYLIDAILEELPEDEHIYQIDLHKILFLLRENLKDTNYVNDYLPFYWYRHGPVCDVANSAAQQATKQAFIERDQTQNVTRYRRGPKRPERPSVDAEQESEFELAIEQLKGVVESYDFHRKRDELVEEEVYTRAPYRFQPFFKFEVIPAVEQFDGDRDSADRIDTLLYLGEGKLPVADAFEEFNEVYSRYGSISSRYLEHQYGNETLLQAKFEALTDKTWLLFSKLLRVVEHEDYYDDRVAEWENSYSGELNSYRNELRSFESMVADEFTDSDRVERADLDSAWGSVADAILMPEE